MARCCWKRASIPALCRDESLEEREAETNGYVIPSPQGEKSVTRSRIPPRFARRNDMSSGGYAMAVPATVIDKFATLNGLRIHFLDWENLGAPAIVMLHGLRSYAHVWDGVARPLAPDYRILALDQRGRGDSDRDPAAGYNTEAYVSDLEQFVDSLGLDRF